MNNMRTACEQYGHPWMRSSWALPPTCHQHQS